jgi:hypothetical protein
MIYRDSERSSNCRSEEFEMDHDEMVRKLRKYGCSDDQINTVESAPADVQWMLVRWRRRITVLEKQGRALAVGFAVLFFLLITLGSLVMLLLWLLLN